MMINNMGKQEVTESACDKSLKKIFVFWFVLIVLGLILAFIYFMKFKSPAPVPVQKPDITPKAEIPAVPKNGEFMLMSPDNKQVFLSNKDFEIDLVASSDKNIISGYDVIISYDKNKIKFIEAVNKLEGMDLQVNKSAEGIVSITTVKNTNTNNNFVFANSTLLTYKFKTLKTGSFDIKFVFKYDQTTDSNLVTINADDILGKVSDYKGYVGDLIKVTKNKQTFKKEYYISLKTADTSQGKLNDGSIKYIVEVTKGGQVKELTFERGSIAGKPMTGQQAFGMIFEPIDYNTQEIMLLVAEI